MNYVNENDNGTPWADDNYFPWYRNVMTLKKVHFIQNGYKFLNRQTLMINNHWKTIALSGIC